MNSDPIRGRTIRFTFSDGPLAKKTFEHVFDTRGTVTFRRMGDGASPSAGKNGNGDEVKVSGPKYEIAMVGRTSGRCRTWKAAIR
jgi:hypothetical protein